MTRVRVSCANCVHNPVCMYSHFKVPVDVEQLRGHCLHFISDSDIVNGEDFCSGGEVRRCKECSLSITKEKLELIQQFENLLMDEFIVRCGGNDFRKLNLLTIAHVVSSVGSHLHDSIVNYK